MHLKCRTADLHPGVVLSNIKRDYSLRHYEDQCRVTRTASLYRERNHVMGVYSRRHNGAQKQDELHSFRPILFCCKRGDPHLYPEGPYVLLTQAWHDILMSVSVGSIPFAVFVETTTRGNKSALPVLARAVEGRSTLFRAQGPGQLRKK